VELQRSKKEGKDKVLMVREAIEVDSDELMEPKKPILKKGKRANRMCDSSDDSSDDSDDDQNEEKLQDTGYAMMKIK